MRSHKRSIMLNENGVALAMVLVLSAVALAIMAALVYMLTASTQVSGIQKRYRTAIDAGKGGADVTYKMIAGRGDSTLNGLASQLTFFSMPASNKILSNGSISQSCLIWKLNNSTNAWPNGGTPGTSCDTSVSINPNDSNTYDMYFELGATATYKVYSKIVSTVEGNSGGDIGLIKSGVVNASPGEIPVVSRPYLYSIEVEAENKANPQERAKYSILYQY